MFLDHFISLTDLRRKMHVMNHANRLVTLLISPFMRFILYRGISRVIGLMSDKRSDAILLSAIYGTWWSCERERTSPWQYFTLQAHSHAGSMKNLFARDLPYGESLLNISPGIKRILKGDGVRAVEGKNARTRVRFIVKRTGLCHAYKFLWLSLSLSLDEGEGTRVRQRRKKP